MEELEGDAAEEEQRPSRELGGQAAMALGLCVRESASREGKRARRRALGEGGAGARPYAARCGGVHASKREATRRLAPAGGRPVMLLRINSNF